MIIGDYNKLTVKRISDIAYILADGENEIFLHKKEAEKPYEVGDEVNLFIYLDSKRRPAATSLKPLITASTPAFLKVVEIKEGLGFFLYYGMPKDLLLSFIDVPFSEENYPEVGDMLYVYLKTTNNNFRAKVLPKSAFYDYMHPKGSLKEKDSVKVYIVQIKKDGIVAFTLDGFEVFIPIYYSRERHRIGEELTVEIIKTIDERSYQGSLIKKKELQIDDDSKMVLDYLKIYKKTSLTDKSDPIDIYQTFQMSKAAYKRAIGRLYKEKLIDLSDDSVQLKVE